MPFDCQKIAKNLTFFQKKCQKSSFFSKKLPLAICWQSNGNFPEGQMTSVWLQQKKQHLLDLVKFPLDDVDHLVYVWGKELRDNLPGTQPQHGQTDALHRTSADIHGVRRRLAEYLIGNCQSWGHLFQLQSDKKRKSRNLWLN